MNKFLLLIFLQAPLFALSATSGVTSISGTGTHTNSEIAGNQAGQAMAVWVEAFPNKIETAYYNGSSWASPVTLAFGSFPQVAIDGSGNAITVWLDTSNNQIYAARYNATSNTWSAVVQLSTSGINASPKIAMNARGNALAVWTVASPQQLLGASFNINSLSWSSPVALVSGSGSFPLVTLNNSNSGLVLWSNAQFGVESITVSVP